MSEDSSQTEINDLRSRMAVVDIVGRQAVEIERLRKGVDELLRRNTEQLEAGHLARRKLKVAMSYLSELAPFHGIAQSAVNKIDRNDF